MHMSLDRLPGVPVVILVISAAALLLPTTNLDARTLRSAKKDTHSVRRSSEIAKISEQWAREWKAKNVNALMALYADDAVFLPATGSRVSGRAAIRELFEKALAANTSEVLVHSKVTDQSGRLAYDSGEYDETGTSGGVKRSGRGNYLVVLRRDSQNRWRIVEHMWTDVPTGH